MKVNYTRRKQFPIAPAFRHPLTVPLSTIRQRAASMAKNVLGTELLPCCFDPRTGFYRDGYCRTGSSDYGVHTVCAEMTQAFLEFSQAAGNDLITPVPEYHFPGLKPGDRWCLCVQRWTEALQAGVAPQVILEATHMSSLEFTTLEDLKSHSLNQES
jgi:uncharacterized protein (DUF2237 family)